MTVRARRSSPDLLGAANGESGHAAAENDRLVVGNDQWDAFQEDLRTLARRLWPYPATTAELARFADIDRRSAQRFVARQRTLSLRAFRTLCRSEAGAPFVELMMRGAAPAHWTEQREARRLAEITRERRRLDREARDLLEGLSSAGR